MTHTVNLKRAWKCFLNNESSKSHKQAGELWKTLTEVEKLSYIDFSVPENHGKKWCVKEDTDLMFDIVENYSSSFNLNDISIKYKRTIVSIKLRLCKLVMIIVKKDNITIEQASNLVHLIVSVKELEDYCKEIQEKEQVIDKAGEEIKKEIKKEKEIKIQNYEINNKQQEAFNIMNNGENIFLTGAGGVGKTKCINLFVNYYTINSIFGHLGKKVLGVTSTTGTSAILFGGSTLHSFLGIGLGKANVESLYGIIISKKYLRSRWMNLKTLIIDEVSMLNPELFDKLELLARRLRNNDKPFGGIQLILSGDFLQLPVVDNNKFCFEADSWNRCVSNIVYLTDIIRQTDISFQNCLNEIRFGIISDETKNILNSRIDIELTNTSGIKPTKLFSLNRDVDYINNKEISKINSQFYQYEMIIENIGQVSEYIINKCVKNCQVPEVIELAIGAQVMLLYNMDFDKELINGSRGIIIGFNVDDIPIVKFLNGIQQVIDFHTWEISENNKIIIEISQIPLKLAYSFTIHKLQGSSLDYVEIDLNNIFEFGQAYVALSRVRNIEGLKITGGIDYSMIKAHPTAVEFYKLLN